MIITLNNKTLVKSLLALIFLFVFTVVPFFYGCDSDDDENTTHAGFDTYFPMNQGNRWSFNVSSEEEQGAGEAEVKAGASFNGYDSIPLQLTETSGQGLGSGLVYITADTSRADVLGARYEADTLVLDQPFNFLNFPLEVGKSWFSDAGITVEGVQITILAETVVVAQENITVSGMSYTHCFKLTSDITVTAIIVIPISVDLHLTMWLAPDIGPVKALAEVPELPLFPEIPTGTITVELTETNF
ncbi:hypothetical protein ACFL27_28840 [candidate division CSSED10-310 bacterium]|uniref:Lipid/polyisoprenoid-binding YceI-like domain-containing protein n=1 Tax=candidate division CSSED10-310 bacterium TaxID=2855610 RepID=A0ABV6Z6Z8_UNCC1